MFTALYTAALAASGLFLNKFKTYFIIAGVVVGIFLTIALTLLFVTHRFESKAAMIQKQADMIAVQKDEISLLKGQVAACTRVRAPAKGRKSILPNFLEGKL